MSDETKPREFWFIYGDELGDNGCETMIFDYKDETYDEQYGLTHVIEYSAYAEIKAREEKLESALDQILSSSHDSWTINLINEAMK